MQGLRQGEPVRLRAVRVREGAAPHRQPAGGDRRPAERQQRFPQDQPRRSRRSSRPPRRPPRRATSVPIRKSVAGGKLPRRRRLERPGHRDGREAKAPKATIAKLGQRGRSRPRAARGRHRRPRRSPRRSARWRSAPKDRRRPRHPRGCAPRRRRVSAEPLGERVGECQAAGELLEHPRAKLRHRARELVALELPRRLGRRQPANVSRIERERGDRPELGRLLGQRGDQLRVERRGGPRPPSSGSSGRTCSARPRRRRRSARRSSRCSPAREQPQRVRLDATRGSSPSCARAARAALCRLRRHAQILPCRRAEPPRPRRREEPQREHDADDGDAAADPQHRVHALTNALCTDSSSVRRAEPLRRPDAGGDALARGAAGAPSAQRAAVGGAQHGAEDRDADRAADLPHRHQQRRADAAALGRQGADRGVHRRGQREAQAGADHGQPGRGEAVAGVRRRGGAGEQPGREQREADATIATAPTRGASRSASWAPTSRPPMTGSSRRPVPSASAPSTAWKNCGIANSTPNMREHRRAWRDAAPR